MLLNQLTNSQLWHYLKVFFSFLKHLLIKRYRLLLLLLGAIFLPLYIFGELAEEIWEQEAGFWWDIPILLGIRATASPQLDSFATILTKTGVFWGVLPLSIMILLVLLFYRRWRSLAYLLITLLGSVVINRTAKVLLHRVRPHLWESPAPEFDYGFPSGHAMSSMTFVAALVILTWGSRWCPWVILCGGIFVVAIAWTRLYLGVHYPSDIVAGWVASIAWATGVSLLIKPMLFTNAE